MALLDRDRTPVRFTVVTSVVSGLIVAGSIALARSGLLTSSVPLWSLPVAIALTATSLVLLRKMVSRPAQARQVFVVVPAFEQKYWLAGLVRRLHGRIDRDGVDMVLKLPACDYDASAQAHLLGRVQDRHAAYMGGIVVATAVDQQRATLTEFCASSGLPVVFTDAEPFEHEHEYPDNAVYVGYRSAQLGELAGTWLTQHLRQRGMTRPHVLIIASREHTARQEQCRKVLRNAIPDVSITELSDCDFRRSRAYDAVRAHIRRLGSREIRLDAVFCTNDEMALGAVDAIGSTPSAATQDTVVIGIDGIAEARALIDKGKSPLRATVVQDANRLAERTVLALEALHKDKKVQKRTYLEGQLHPAG
ncbi:ribose transport system substrate-binding protein [Lentzea xinjiangensis]|uniref:Ribose transport system substrate-binding protein n=1 Tax=Lentzea xinjiangensis TaxID=402600 RepID=A0A1H9P7L9_9PSEU|nr:substrate-binding domain-containing protein [Lentzea xinjiangensis]SER43789.1 ribose transport system substrate-binding protein [Lentzea xinjiangensis]